MYKRQIEGCDPYKEKYIHFGDGAHAWRQNWCKAKFPRQFRDHVCVPAEFHGHHHFQEGAVELNWHHNYEPIVLHFDVGARFSKKANMKDYSTRLRWSLIILTATLLWLKSWCPEELLDDIPALLHNVRNNLPVWDFIGFAFYFLSPIHFFKEAMQCSDTGILDFMWPYSLRVYQGTQKRIYKCLCVIAHKIHKDSEQRVRYILKHFRTVSDTERRCAAMALDLKNEKVPPSARTLNLIIYLFPVECCVRNRSQVPV